MNKNQKFLLGVTLFLFGQVVFYLGLTHQYPPQIAAGVLVMFMGSFFLPVIR